METFFTEYLSNLEEMHSEIRISIQGLSLEALDWTPGGEMNTMAVLVIHSIGAERYWIGDVLTGEPSGRDREAEFKVQGIPHDGLIHRLGEHETYVRKALEKLTVNDLDVRRVSPRNGREVTVGWALCHALKHTALHAGHIQMTRQLWDQRTNIKI